MNKHVVIDEVPVIGGLSYYRMLKQMHLRLQPEWYLEVGTFTGRSLSHARSNVISVDPNYKIKFPVINPAGQQMFFFQQTSDEFFDSGFIKNNKIAVDFAFLDGMHLYEYLLRDFINTEKVMSDDGVIALHDCCPTTEYMTTREYHDGGWTGDVWKTLLILKEYRPDLQIDVTNARSTGLVVIRNLKPRGKVLSNAYDEAVAKYADIEISDLPGGLPGYYSQFELKDAREVLETL